jgi:hypothetical protein
MTDAEAGRHVRRQDDDGGEDDDDPTADTDGMGDAPSDTEGGED